MWKLHDCCRNKADWSETMDDLARYFGAGHAMLQVLTLSNGRLGGPRRICSTNHNDQLYLDHFSDAQNPRLEADRFLSRALDHVIDDDELFERAEASVLSRWRQKLASAGMGHFIGAMTELEEGHYLGIALHKPTSSRRAFGVAQRRDLMQMLPDLGQAVGIDTHVRQQVARDAGLRAWANHSHLAVLICGSQARIIWMNARAKQFIESLSDQSRPASRTWYSARTNSLRREASALHERGVGSRLLQINTPDGPVHVALQVVQSENDVVVSTASHQVLVTMSRPDWTPTLTSSAAQVMFDLTPSEAILARDIASGLSLDAHATKRCISITTARWYLKQVLAKVGVARQQDLVRVLVCSAASRVN